MCSFRWAIFLKSGSTDKTRKCYSKFIESERCPWLIQVVLSPIAYGYLVTAVAWKSYLNQSDVNVMNRDMHLIDPSLSVSQHVIG